jgi:hypothetical protein
MKWSQVHTGDLGVQLVGDVHAGLKDTDTNGWILD